MNSTVATEQLTLLGVFAHPDDEQGVGGAFTKAVREHGAKAYIVSVTSGQAGQISDPALATPETLGEVREQELRDAVALYGWEPPILLRYQDGQVADLPPGQLRDDLVKIIRQLKPQVLVTFEKTGVYGHVDHIAVHFETFAAFEKAADPNHRPDLGPAHQVAKFYYTAMPRSVMREITRAMGEEMDFGGDERTIEIDELGIPDEEITTLVDVHDLVALRSAGMFVHKTQFGEEMRKRIETRRKSNDFFGQEAFIRAYPAPDPDATFPDETSILEGIV
jgi:LmbE family N-acetylglucosaminyl deacetylase